MGTAPHWVHAFLRLASCSAGMCVVTPLSFPHRLACLQRRRRGRGGRPHTRPACTPACTAHTASWARAARCACCAGGPRAVLPPWLRCAAAAAGARASGPLQTPLDAASLTCTLPAAACCLPQVGRRLTGVTILSGSVVRIPAAATHTRLPCGARAWGRAPVGAARASRVAGSSATLTPGCPQVRIWDSLERVLSRHEMELSKSDRGEPSRAAACLLPAGVASCAAQVAVAGLLPPAAGRAGSAPGREAAAAPATPCSCSAAHRASRLW